MRKIKHVTEQRLSGPVLDQSDHPVSRIAHSGGALLYIYMACQKRAPSPKAGIFWGCSRKKRIDRFGHGQNKPRHDPSAKTYQLSPVTYANTLRRSGCGQTSISGSYGRDTQNRPQVQLHFDTDHQHAAKSGARGEQYVSGGPRISTLATESKII